MRWWGEQGVRKTRLFQHPCEHCSPWVFKAVKIAQKFIPSAEIDEKTMKAFEDVDAQGIDEDMMEQLNAGRDMNAPEGQ